MRRKSPLIFIAFLLRLRNKSPANDRRFFGFCLINPIKVQNSFAFILFKCSTQKRKTISGKRQDWTNHVPRPVHFSHFLFLLVVFETGNSAVSDLICNIINQWGNHHLYRHLTKGLFVRIDFLYSRNKFYIIRGIQSIDEGIEKKKIKQGCNLILKSPFNVFAVYEETRMRRHFLID